MLSKRAKKSKKLNKLEKLERRERLRKLRQFKKLKNKKISFNFYIIVLFLVLIAIALLSVMNIFSVVALKNQTETLLNSAGVINNHLNKNGSLPVTGATGTTEINNATTSPTSTASTASTATTTPSPTNPIYSNVTAEPFFETHLIDMPKTTMRLDKKVNALTFEPAYDLKLSGDCSAKYCGALEKSDSPLTDKNGQIYYKGNQLSLPSELAGKKILNFTFSRLNSKWVVGVIFNDGGQEVGYAYLFDGQKLSPLINDQTGPKIRTQYGHDGGRISVGGSDTQFIVLYVGYEGIGYLYNNGSWQDISSYFGLRVIDGGFTPQIILSGSGKAATWYVCSDDTAKAKLVKLWQNNTDNIQGAIDLSDILTDGQLICRLKSNKELNIYSQTKSYLFKDKGFNTGKQYLYESLNLSDYVGKTIQTVRLSSYVINARPNYYTLSISADGTNWQPNNDKEIDLSATNSETFYVKGDFKTSEANYSPWFGGIKLISYTAKDKK